MIAPSAVPEPPVASAPVLQCVRIAAPWRNSGTAASPMRRSISRCSAWMRRASSRYAPSPRARTRSTARARLTAVGRAARIRSTSAANAASGAANGQRRDRLDDVVGRRGTTSLDYVGERTLIDVTDRVALPPNGLENLHFASLHFAARGGTA